jgi:hypothetical protein
MAVSAVVSWAASRSAGVVVAGPDWGGAVVDTFEAGGTVLTVVVVAVLLGATGGGLAVDRLPPEQATNNRPAANRATSRWIWR